MNRWARGLWTGRTPRLVVLAVVVGAGAGLGAVVLIKSIEWVRLAAGAIEDTLTLGQWGILLIVPVAIWAAWRVTSWFAPEVAGHGVPQILAAIAVRGGQIRERVIPLKIVATALTIGGGGSAGREGSIAQIGSAIGSGLGRFARLGENDVIALVAAGAGAGISATFNAPIAGMFFAMEVILREISIRHLHTVVIASVSGAVVAHSILGDELTFTVPPHLLDDPRQLLLYGALGLVTVAFGLFYLVALDWFEVRKIPLPTWTRPLLFGLLVGALALVWPEISGTGQEFVNTLLQGESGLAWWTLGILALAKAIATSATLGGKGSGGIFMPSLFIGAAAGAGFARLIGPAWPFSQVPAGAFALVGMAATFSAVARAPLTSILIVFEITGDYGLVLPLMVATIVSTSLARVIRPESAYTAPLSRMGIHPTRGAMTDLLQTISVGSITGVEPVTVDPRTNLQEALHVMVANRVGGLPVVAEGTLVGVITEGDITRHGGPDDQILVEEVMTRNPVSVTPSTPVADALERMAALGVGRLPIVAERDRDKFVGEFSRDNVVTAYHQALNANTRTESVRRIPDAADEDVARFHELKIPSGSIADQRRVSEIQWPDDSLLVSIHRGSEIIVPNGDTELAAGDSITVFGSAATGDRLLARLVRTADTTASPPTESD